MTTKLGKTFLLTVAAPTLFVSMVAAGSPASQSASTAHPPEPREEARGEAFAQVCLTCHDDGHVRAFRRTRAGWKEVINTMITQQGVLGADEDFELALQYMLSQYGLINVNTAPPEDLELVLEVSEIAAQGIVAFRDKNGNFKDLDALSKVPGIDAKKLESKKRALQF